MDDNVTALMSAFDIRCVPVHQRCAPSETHAAGAIRSIANRHGPDHLERVLHCLTAREETRAGLWSETIAAISDCLLFRSDWTVERLVCAFEGVDLQKHRAKAVRLRPWPVRGSLRSLIDIDLTAWEKQHYARH